MAIVRHRVVRIRGRRVVFTSRLPMKIFDVRSGHGGVDVTVDGVELAPRHDLVDYSQPLTGGPFVWRWGDGSSGSAALALAILAECFSDAIAVDFHQRFKWAAIARVTSFNWQLTSRQVEAWFEQPTRPLFDEQGAAL